MNTAATNYEMPRQRSSTNVLIDWNAVAIAPPSTSSASVNDPSDNGVGEADQHIELAHHYGTSEGLNR